MDAQRMDGRNLEVIIARLLVGIMVVLLVLSLTSP
jgi:hypothetical protein